MPTAEELDPGTHYIVDGTVLVMGRSRRALLREAQDHGHERPSGMHVRRAPRLDLRSDRRSTPRRFCLDESSVLHTLDPGNWTGDKGYVGRGMVTPIKKNIHREMLD